MTTGEESNSMKGIVLAGGTGSRLRPLYSDILQVST